MTPPEVRGFWAAAAADPDRLAVVDPDGRERTAGEISAAANQLVHALRDKSNLEDCLMAGRKNCVPLDLPSSK